MTISFESTAGIDNAALASEKSRRDWVIKVLRGNDANGEAVTNRLMEQLSDNPQILYRDRETVIAITPEPLKPFVCTEQYHRDGITLRCSIGTKEMSPTMASRLRSLYVSQHPIRHLTPEYLGDFSRSAFMLLYRYSYIDPGFRRQGYLAPKYFDAIWDAFGRPVDLESFAAAFNTTAPSYCSLFPDVERPFGSRGSFFDLKSLGVEDQLIQVSPPRVGRITMQAVEHSIRLLKDSSDVVVRYFVLLTPTAWPDIGEAIEKSGFLVWSNRTKRGDTIEYNDVVKNESTRFPMPRVSVMSNRSLPLDDRTSNVLHEAFSNMD